MKALTKYSIIITVLLFIATSFLIYMATDYQKVAADTWWDSSWAYKQPFYINTGSGAISSGFQTEFYLNSSMTGANFDWSQECNSDGNASRVRFVNSEENAVLNWTVLWCNASEQKGKFTVVLDRELNTTNITYYMYYGNPSANFEEHGANIYPYFFDNFEDCNADGWTGIDIAITTSRKRGSCGLLLNNNDTSSAYADKICPTANTSGRTIQFDVYGDNADYEIKLMSGDGGQKISNAGLRRNSGPIYGYYYDTANHYAGWYDTSDWRELSFRGIDWSANSYRIWIYNVTRWEDTFGANAGMQANTHQNGIIELYSCSNVCTGAVYADNVRVREYDADEQYVSISTGTETSETTDLAPVTTLTSPSDNVYSGGTITFNCSATDDFNIANISLWTNSTGTWHQNATNTTVSGTYDFAIFDVDLGYADKTIIWNCITYDNASQSDWGNSNRTLHITTPGDLRTVWDSSTDSDNAEITGSDYKRWFFANITSNSTITSAKLEVLKPDTSTPINKTMTIDGKYAYYNYSVIRTQTGNGTYYYRAYIGNSTATNTTEWRKINFTIMYVDYNKLATGKPESCFSRDGLFYCADLDGSTNMYMAFYTNNGTTLHVYGTDSVGSNTAPLVDDDYVWGIGYDCVFTKFYKNNESIICTHDLGTNCGQEVMPASNDFTKAYVHKSDDELYEMNMSNCALLQETNTTFWGAMYPVMDEDNNRLYIMGDGTAYSYYLNNFTVDWTATVDSHGNYGTPVLVNDTYTNYTYLVIFPTESAHVTAFYFNGTQAWDVDAGKEIYQGGAYKNGLYVVSDAEQADAQPMITAWHVNNGSLAWNWTNYSLTHCANGPVIITGRNGDYVLGRCGFCDNDGTCQGTGPNGYSNYYQYSPIIDLNTGRFIDGVRYGMKKTSMTTIVGGGIFLTGSQNNDYHWHAIRLSSSGDSTNSTPAYADINHTRDFGTTRFVGLFWEAADTTPPVITLSYPINNSIIPSMSFTMEITTDENADCEYSTSDFNYGSGTDFTSTGGTTHTSTLSLTTGNHNYFFRCNDTAGNNNTASTQASFSLVEYWNQSLNDNSHFDEISNITIQNGIANITGEWLAKSRGSAQYRSYGLYNNGTAIIDNYREKSTSYLRRTRSYDNAWTWTASETWSNLGTYLGTLGFDLEGNAKLPFSASGNLYFTNIDSNGENGTVYNLGFYPSSDPVYWHINSTTQAIYHACHDPKDTCVVYNTSDDFSTWTSDYNLIDNTYPIEDLSICHLPNGYTMLYWECEDEGDNTDSHMNSTLLDTDGNIVAFNRLYEYPDGDENVEGNFECWVYNSTTIWIYFSSTMSYGAAADNYDLVKIECDISDVGVGNTITCTNVTETIKEYEGDGTGLFSGHDLRHVVTNQGEYILTANDHYPDNDEGWLIRRIKQTPSELMTEAITPSTLWGWDEIDCNVLNEPYGNTSLMVTVLNASDNSSISGFTRHNCDGVWDISGLSASYSSIRLNISFESNVSLYTPVLEDINVSWFETSQNTAPSLYINSPADNYNTSDKTPDFSFMQTDDNDTASCELFIGGTGYGINDTVWSGVDTIITANSSLSDGSYSWYINCTDSGGLSTTSTARTITIDTSAPTISFSSNSTQGITTKDYIYYCAVVSDLTLDVVGHYFNGANYTSWDADYCKNQTGLTDGDYSVYLWANDTFNHYNQTETRTITIDTVAPTINMDFPSPGQFIDSDWINITGTASDANPDRVETNYVCPPVLNFNNTNQGTYENWNITATRGTDGYCHFEIVAWDLAGHTQIISSNITIDTIYPSIDWSTNSTTAGDYVQNYIYYCADITETNPDTIGYSFNSVNYTSWDADYCINKTGLSEGTYVIYLWINDSVGHGAETVSRTYTIDTSTPDIVITSPQNTTYSTTIISLNYWTSETMDWVGYSLNGGSNVTITGNTTITASQGSNSIYVCGNDTSGNMNCTETIYFSVDSIAPTVAIYEPNGQYNDTSSIPISFSASDTNLDSCWYNFNGTDYDLPGCTNTTISVSNGTYTMTIYANDTYGNQNSDSSSFTSGWNLLNVVITYPENDGIIFTDRLSFINSEAYGPYYVNFTLSDTNVSLIGIYDYNYGFAYTQNISLDVGWNTILLRVGPTDGNWSLDNIFASVWDNVEEIRFYDYITETWKSYSMDYPSYSDLEEAHTYSYMTIKMNTADDFSFTGYLGLLNLYKTIDIENSYMFFMSHSGAETMTINATRDATIKTDVNSFYAYDNSFYVSPTNPMEGDTLSASFGSSLYGDNQYFRYSYINGTIIRDWSADANYTIPEGMAGETLNISGIIEVNGTNSTELYETIKITDINITEPDNDEIIFNNSIQFSFNLTAQDPILCYEYIDSTQYNLSYITDGIQTNTRSVTTYGNHTYEVECVNAMNSFNKTINFTNHYANWTIALYTEDDWDVPFDTNGTNSTLYIYCDNQDTYNYPLTNSTTNNIVVDCDVNSIAVLLSYSTDSYLREIVPQTREGTVRLYLADAYLYTIYQIPIDMNDYNYFNSTIYLYKKSNSTEYIITSGSFDVEHKFIAYLKKDNKYFMRILKGSEINENGYLYASSTDTQDLYLSNVNLVADTPLISNDILMGAKFIDNTTLNIKYNDTLNKTNTLQITVYDDNKSVVYNNTWTGLDLLNLVIPGLNNTHRYTIDFNVDHQQLGNSPVLRTMGVGGLSNTMLGIPTWLYIILTLAVALIVIFTVVPENRFIGLIMLAGVMAWTGFMGWMQNTSGNPIGAYTSVLIMIFIALGIVYELMRGAGR